MIAGLVLVSGTVAPTAAAPPSNDPGVRRFQLRTPDGVTIAASYFPTTVAPAPGALLLHGLGGTQKEWQFFAEQLQTNGIAALIIELRGHGGSTSQTTRTGPVTLDCRRLRPDDFQDMLLEINSAWDWLAHQPGVDRTRLAVVGSSISANLALRYALFNDDLAALVLVSPGLVYREVRTDDAIPLVGSLPIRVLVASGDGFAYESSKRLRTLCHQARGNDAGLELTVEPGILHGTKLLRGIPGAATDLVQWLGRALASRPARAPAPGSPVAP
ncbi:alpha/beta fold hydrolase [bacterium]|nr:alpha/beta fold hydrolase [bacterium]